MSGNTNKDSNKGENIWSSILSETGEKKKFQNKQLLVLGSKGSGKRTLIDSLHEISSTTFPKVKKNDTQSGKLRVAGSASALDYVYLNVRNLDEAEEETMANLNVYLLDDASNKELLSLVLTPTTVLDTTIAIVLDLAEPWTFMEQLDKWMETINQHLTQLQLPLELFDQMKMRTEKRIRDYKEPAVDSEGKLISSAEAKRLQKDEQRDLQKIKDSVPLPEGVLTTNPGFPIVIVANKSDLMVESNQNDSPMGIAILYYLRKYCATYGATLVYTSSKSTENLSVLYEYVLHTLYGFQLRHKYELNNLESIFVPSGMDNITLIKQSNPHFDETLAYDAQVRQPQPKNGKKEEEFCEDEQEFLKNLMNEKLNPEQAVNQLASKFASSSSSVASILRGAQTATSTTSTLGSSSSISAPKNNTNVAIFYKELLNKPDNKTMRQNAEKDLLLKMGSVATSSSNLFRTDEIEQVKDLLKKKN